MVNVHGLGKNRYHGQFQKHDLPGRACRNVSWHKATVTTPRHCALSSFLAMAVTIVLLMAVNVQAAKNQHHNSFNTSEHHLRPTTSLSDKLAHKGLTYYQHKHRETLPDIFDAQTGHRHFIMNGYSNATHSKGIQRHLSFSNEGCVVSVNETAIISNICIHKCTFHETDLPGLDMALNCAKQNLINNTGVKVKILSERLTLSQTHHFEGGLSLHFTGMPSSIVCNTSQLSGLRFTNSQDIVFEDLTFHGCGLQFTSKSRNFENTRSNVMVKSLSAIYFSKCTDITLSNISITNSEGTGLTLVNCHGTINITASYFINNSIKNDVAIPGGGGISIEGIGDYSQTKCNNDLSSDSCRANYYISKCTFNKNTASSGHFYITHITSNYNYFSFGQGGGLSVNFRNTTNNKLKIQDCHFENNAAQRGGAMYVGFRSDSERNHISIYNVTFSKNKCLKAKVPPGANYSSGGAIKAMFYTNSRRNNFTINASIFEGNNAYFGGALSFVSGADYNGNKSEKECTFNISKCTFERNSARIGAAVDLYYRVSAEETNYGSSVFPCIHDSNFTGNKGLYQYDTDNATGRTFATIYIQHIPSRFEGTIQVTMNEASGFGIEEATVHFGNNTFVNLTNNTAKIGGAIAMIGKATLVLHKNTTVTFDSNVATDKGGAIFASQSQERYSAYDYTCFVKYHDRDMKNPSEWNITLNFSKNIMANDKRNDIYATSLLPCVWPSNASSKLEDDLKKTFCGWGKPWILNFNTSGGTSNTCSDLIETAPSRFSQSHFNLTLIPGKMTKIENFRVLDDLNHRVSALYTTSRITLHISKNTKINPSGIDVLVTNDSIRLKTNESFKANESLSIVLQTADQKSVTTVIDVTVAHCPPGYELSNSVCTCNRHSSFRNFIKCNESWFTSLIFAGHCITYSSIKLPNHSLKTDEVIIARCPYAVGNITDLYKELPPKDIRENPYSFCQLFRRTGKLCGECLPGLSLDVYSTSFQCIPCNNSTHNYNLNWVKVILVSTVPTTILFILCTVFHISITSAHTNGYIFFSHVITMRIDVLTEQYVWHYYKHTHETHTDILYAPYYVWTFNFPQIFLRKICLGENFKVIDAIALQYLSVLYPLLLVITAIILIELHAKNCKPLVWLWKPLCYLCVRFRHSWHIRTSVIDTFASFMLLSYSNLIGVSMSLLSPSSVFIKNGTVVGRTLNYDTSVDYFEKTHLKFGIFAIIILCTLGAIPPLLLIFYPFKWFQYLLNKCNLRRRFFLQVFVDAFQGSYKNSVKGYPERRYFAGVYFLFRIVINVIYIAVEDLVVLHLCLTLTYALFMLIILAHRPYKRNYYNILDGVFMGILVVTHAMTMYLLYHAIALQQIPKHPFYFTYAIQHIPTIYMIVLIIYLIGSRMRCMKGLCYKCFGRRTLFFQNKGLQDKNSPRSPLLHDDWPSSSSLILPSPSSPTAESRHLSDIPDRVENPHRYEPMLDSWQFSERGASTQGLSVGELKKKNSSNYGLQY